MHLGIDANELEIRAIEGIDNSVRDAPMLPELLAQIPAHEPIASVGSASAYDTKACHTAVRVRRAQAGTPPRRSAPPWKAHDRTVALRNEAPRAVRHLERSVWKKWSGYHRWSLGETNMHCFKRLGQRVLARTFERQVMELHVRERWSIALTRSGGRPREP